MVEEGDYFIVNRPRQYGKTTTLHGITNALINTGEYLVFNTSFEGIGDVIFETEARFAPGFVGLLSTNAETYAPELVDWLDEAAQTVQHLNTLSKFITRLVTKVTPQPTPKHGGKDDR